jgi:hypothetical protein
VRNNVQIPRTGDFRNQRKNSDPGGLRSHDLRIKRAIPTQYPLVPLGTRHRAHVVGPDATRHHSRLASGKVTAKSPTIESAPFGAPVGLVSRETLALGAALPPLALSRPAGTGIR